MQYNNDHYILLVMKLTETKGEKTKQWIIEVAAKVFNEKGYVGTSISDLTKATQLTSGALYGSFSNKDEIASAAFDYNIDQLLSAYQKHTLKATDPVSQLMNLLDFPSVGLYPLFDGGCPILNTAVEADDTMPWLKKKVNLALEKWVSLIKGIFDRGIAQGLIKDIDGEKYGLFIISAIEGSIMMAKSLNDISIIKNATEHLKQDLKNRIIIS